MKLLFALFLLALLYVGLGILVEFLFLKRSDKQFELDEAAVKRIITWPVRLKDL